MAEPTHRYIETNGIRMHIAEQGSGPLVLLCHGFPESWYSWRHQLRALADAGFHAVAPDMRGFGQTDIPEAIDQYTLLHLVGDMVGLLEALGVAEAAIAGHDWGAPVAWTAALLRPDLFRRVIGLSVPYMPRGTERPTSVMPQQKMPCSISSISRRMVGQRRISKVTSGSLSVATSWPCRATG
jgi:pimeloyl-ACP methyl ester carboxylesterase